MDIQEKEHHSRHILLRELSLTGVRKIRQARVVVIGVGGLAAPLLTYLTTSGVGHITLVDHDNISRSNLARQFLFNQRDIGKAKVAVAVEKLRVLNPAVEFKAIIEKANENNFEALTTKCDLVVETVDSTTNKLLVHDLAFRYQKPLIHGAALAWEGQLLTILPGISPCLRCFFPHLGEPVTSENKLVPYSFTWQDNGDSCSTEGVLSPLCGIIGSYQAAEVLRFFTQSQNDIHIGKMLRIDLLRNRCYYLHPQTKDCPCGFKIGK